VTAFDCRPDRRPALAGKLSGVGLLVLLLGVGLPVQAADDLADFQQQVEPLLRKRCYGCHSHASGTMEGGLTLDLRSGWATGGDRGPAIVPGNVDGSLLVRAIRHEDPDLQMPEEKLPDSEIAILTDWIARGAFDPRTSKPAESLAEGATDWWSLRPLVRPAVPDGVGANPVDAFVRARLRQEHLNPAPPADRRTLLRRLLFDLHGLPPTPEDLEQFAADSQPDAVTRLVDRLLDSPRYGERWARHWLDTIHFADSHGFEHDAFRPHAWRFRDYVIDSFNRDKPWPQFIREQLAADALFPDAPPLLVALGFLGAGPYDHSAAITAPMAFEYLDRDDLVTQTMGAFVSTTANCARCHTHKFDPITQADYFALQAVFAGIGKGNIDFDPDPDVARQRARWSQLQRAAEQQDAAVLLNDEHRRLLAAWEADAGARAAWHSLEAEVFLSSDGATLTRLPDGSLLSGGPRPDKDTTTVTVKTSLARITALRLEVLTDDSLPLKGPGRMDNGNLHLSEFEVRVFRPGSVAGEPVRIRSATADFDQSGWTIQHALDGNLKTAWGIHPAVSQPHHAIFELEEPLTIDPAARLSIVLKQWHGGGHVIGRMKLSATDGPAEAAVALPLAAEQALALPAAERTAEQQTQLAAAVLRHRAVLELRRLPPPAKVYAAAARAENERGVVQFSEPRTIRVLKRGDLDKPGDEVPAGALSAVVDLPARFTLPQPHPESARRAALAEWLADARNPLTWRSIANRVWQYHFGRGLCDTPSDFGRMGSRPSHPELLDWLACELRDNGGSLKALHRLICTSETYQQSSAERDELTARDPDNRLLARMSRQRLDADGYRDAVLVVSGRLDLTMGGPGIAHFSSRPGPQLTPVLDYDQFDWDSPGATRRSIYRVVWRGIPDPLLEALDFPDLGLLAPTRGFSASPLQSLVLLNNRFVLHHARHLSRRMQEAATTLPEQVAAGVHWTWLRAPTAEEQAALVTLAEQHGLPAVARLLLNSNEFLFVD